MFSFTLWSLHPQGNSLWYQFETEEKDGDCNDGNESNMNSTVVVPLNKAFSRNFYCFSLFFRFPAYFNRCSKRHSYKLTTVETMLYLITANVSGAAPGTKKALFSRR
jgi:hypothetical protein